MKKIIVMILSIIIGITIVNATCIEVNYTNQDLLSIGTPIENGALQSDGTEYIDSMYNGWYITDYIEVEPNNTNYIVSTNTNNGRYFCKYNQNKEKISCTSFKDSNISLGNGTYYVKITIPKNVTVTLNAKVCTTETEPEEPEEVENVEQYIKEIRDILVIGLGLVLVITLLLRRVKY